MQPVSAVYRFTLWAGQFAGAGLVGLAIPQALRRTLSYTFQFVQSVRGRRRVEILHTILYTFDEYQVNFTNAIIDYLGIPRVPVVIQQAVGATTLGYLSSIARDVSIFVICARSYRFLCKGLGRAGALISNRLNTVDADASLWRLDDELSALRANTQSEIKIGLPLRGWWVLLQRILTTVGVVGSPQWWNWLANKSFTLFNVIANAFGILGWQQWVDPAAELRLFSEAVEGTIESVFNVLLANPITVVIVFFTSFFARAFAQHYEPAICVSAQLSTRVKPTRTRPSPRKFPLYPEHWQLQPVESRPLAINLLFTRLYHERRPLSVLSVLAFDVRTFEEGWESLSDYKPRYTQGIGGGPVIRLRSRDTYNPIWRLQALRSHKYYRFSALQLAYRIELGVIDFEEREHESTFPLALLVGEEPQLYVLNTAYTYDIFHKRWGYEPLRPLIKRPDAPNEAGLVWLSPLARLWYTLSELEPEPTPDNLNALVRFQRSLRPRSDRRVNWFSSSFAAVTLGPLMVRPDEMDTTILKRLEVQLLSDRGVDDSLRIGRESPSLEPYFIVITHLELPPARQENFSRILVNAFVHYLKDLASVFGWVLRIDNNAITEAMAEANREGDDVSDELILENKLGLVKNLVNPGDATRFYYQFTPSAHLIAVDAHLRAPFGGDIEWDLFT
jgi:hypothetical protein